MAPRGSAGLQDRQGAAFPSRESFHRELHEGRRFQQAVRFGDWKAVRNGLNTPLELYDLAAEKAGLVTKAEGLLRSSRVDDPNWR